MNQDCLTGDGSAWRSAFLERHHLEPAYLGNAQYWFAPLAEALLLHSNGAPLLVAVNGSQGSGKSTLCAYLCALLEAEHGVRALALSLDDFYLTRAERSALGTSEHPLLATRGVPGTHDIGLLGDTLDALMRAANDTVVAVPRFDKAVDDRRPRSGWDEVAGGLDIILLEGWCLGARPQSAACLRHPVNALERNEDPRGIWRSYVNRSLQRDFLPLYERIDTWVMLQAPSFDCVYRWRLEQEQKLARSATGARDGVMNAQQLARFIQHYQRLTEHCLATLPASVDYLYSLDDKRAITAVRPDWERAG